MKKLKGNEIKHTRLELLNLQGNLCAICLMPCSVEQAVLDHCHKGGQVRAVLHRGCNSLLGKVENNAPRYGVQFLQLAAFLTGASKYLDLHQTNVSGLIHPSHFTAAEKLEKRQLKAKKLREKKAKEKLKLKLLKVAQLK